MAQSNFVLFIFFDIPQGNSDNQKAYRRILTYLKNMGFYNLQESIYIKPMSEKHKAQKHIASLRSYAPENSHIRALTLTYQNFMSMQTIMGIDTFGEDLIKKQSSVIVV